MNVAPAAAYDAVLAAGVTGLAGTIELGLLDSDGEFVAELDGDEITEAPAGAGIYFAARVAPEIAGRYLLLWSLDGSTDPDQVRVEELLVTASRAAAPLPGGRDLCTLADVVRYVPAYESFDATDEQLQVLIGAESRELLKLREFTAIPGASVRRFDIDAAAARIRTVVIGDCAEITALELQNANGDHLAELDPSKVITLPLVQEEWEPIHAVRIPAAAGTTHGCQYLQVTGTWGFPFLPDDVVQACAKRVIVRYLNDVAEKGTAFADALEEGQINLAALRGSARETLDFYRYPPVA